MKDKARLSPCSLGLAIGLVIGLYILIFTYVFMWHGEYGETIVEFLEEIYPFYEKDTILGGLIGFGWGLIEGFVFGALVAMIYNKLVKVCCCKK